MWRSWDNAERLRTAFALWLINNKRPLDDLVNITDDKLTLERVLNSVIDVRGGKSYLKKAMYAARAISVTDNYPTAWKYSLLNKMKDQ